MLSPRVYLATVYLTLLAACSPKPAPTTYVDAGTTYLANGWTPAERAEYYHLMEGSELMPYKLVANLKSVKTGKPFLENMERFGFLPDVKSATNPYGMPVGMTVGRSRNADAKGMEMVGFSCAACHSAEVRYRGKSVRIDGAPAMIDLQGYQVEFQQSLDATLKDPAAVVALVVAIEQNVSPEQASSYLNEPAVKNAADVKPAPDADPTFHSISSQAADSAPQPPPPPGLIDRLKTDLAFLRSAWRTSATESC